MRGYMSHVGRSTLLILKISGLSTIDIANYIYEHPTALDLDLQGIWIADRKSFFWISMPSLIFILPSTVALLTWPVVQEQIPAVNFVHKYENVFSFKYATHGPFSPPLMNLTPIL